MKKLFFTTMLSLAFVACQNEDIVTDNTTDSDNNQTEIQLVSINGGEIIPIENNSRATKADSTNYALKFASLSIYQETLKELESMTEKERIAFAQRFGIFSLQAIAQKADAELDAIGEEAANESDFTKKYEEYKKKYEGILIANEYDTEDLSLYVPDGDNMATYLVNASQNIVIGNKVKTLSFTQDMSRSDKAVFTPHVSPLSTSDVNGFQRILNGSKKTTCSVFFDTPSLFVTVSIGIQKKMWYGWKRDNNRDIYYEIELTTFVYNFWGLYGNKINISKLYLYLFQQTGKIDYKTGYYYVSSNKKPLTGNIWVWHDILLQGASQKTYNSVVCNSLVQKMTLPTCNHNDEYSCSISYNPYQ